MLESVFQKLELKKLHAQVYMVLLESGASPAGKLAKHFNMPRSTVYVLLDELVQKGLATQNEKDNVKLWQAIEPEKIELIINEKITSLEDTKNSFKNMLESLKQKRQTTDFFSPKFSFYEGSEGVKQIYKDVLFYRDIDTEIFWPMPEVMDIVGADFIRQHNKQRIRANISIRGLWPQPKEVDITKNIFLGAGKGFKREIRLAPEGIDFTLGYWSYANKVAFISSKKEGFAFIVESKELQQFLHSQFEFIWKLSKPVMVDPKITKPFLDEVGGSYDDDE